MIETRYYKNMEIVLVETFRDVIEHAFVDCARKQEYMDKLLPLQKDGVSTAVRLEPPVVAEYTKPVEDVPAEAETVETVAEEPAPVTTVDVVNDSNPAPQ